jgi:hypothetical protein
MFAITVDNQLNLRDSDGERERGELWRGEAKLQRNYF